MLFESMREEARDDIINRLEEGYGGCLCDFHNELFNAEDKYISDSDAINALNEDGIFEAIGKIIEYEKSGFGEIFTDFTKHCEVANMLYYIIGEEEIDCIFDRCKEWSEWQEKEVNDADCKVLLSWVKYRCRI